MSCCPPILTTFLDAEETIIPYPQSLRDVYGNVPTIKVAYLENGIYKESAGFITHIALDTDEIKINHGGPATGVIKLN